MAPSPEEPAAFAPLSPITPSSFLHFSKPSPISEPLSPLGSHLRRVLAGPKSSTPPSVARLSIPLTLSGSPHAWWSALSGLGFTSARESGRRLELELAESLDLHGKPHQFIRLALEPSAIHLQYTVAAGQHPARRKLQAWQLALLALAASRAWAAGADFNQQLADALSEGLALLSEDADALRLRAEAAERRALELAARIGPLQSQREADAKRQLADAQTLQALSERIRHLEHLPDSALDGELMEWLRAHDGSLGVRDVARSLGVAAQRVEDALDRLCKAGRIQRVKE